MSFFDSIRQELRQAAARMACAATKDKNAALLAIAEQLQHDKQAIIAANTADIAAARRNGISDALLDRLTLTDARFAAMIDGLLAVAGLADPVGEIEGLHFRPSGIQVGRMRVPIGVIGIIYESRPNVTVDAAALCLKSGNVAILRGGSETIATNTAIANAITNGCLAAGLPAHCVYIVTSAERTVVGDMLKANDIIDLIIPRGGKGLIRRVIDEATMPILKHLDGNCHVYVDDCADIEKALSITINAKCRRFGVCNAMETLLVHETVADQFLPSFVQLATPFSLTLRGCPRTQAVIHCEAATEEDWYEEYLAPILAIRIVASIDEAIAHINHYGSHHTDAIVSQDVSRCQHFLASIDSSSVILNASTAFADGYEYGLGAEIGISTDKLHARGPVGLYGLTSQKYVVFGNGNIRP